MRTIKIYNIYQSGKNLYIDEKENPDNKIVVNKYDNMQQTLKLISDGTLPPHLYWALRNPKLSQKYFILPLVNDNELIVGTDVSATPGLWDMLLIGTPDDYIIEGTDIDQSKLTYVSDHFARLFVRDNFLEELDFEEQTSPTFRVFYDEIMFQLGNKEEKSLVAEYGITTYNEIKDTYERGCDIRVKYTVEIINSLAPGTYDADGNLLQTWDELMETWGRDIEEFSPPYNDLGYVISDDAIKLVIPEGITQINGYILQNNTCQIETVVLPSTLTAIYGSALNSPTLKQLAIPNGVTHLNRYGAYLQRIYFNGTLNVPPYVIGSIEVLPYEDAPEELVPGKDEIYDLLGNLELGGDEFVFYTTKDDKTLKIVCNADGWSSEKINVAMKDEIPTKTSELENDENYISGVTILDDGQGNVSIVGGESKDVDFVLVDSELSETSMNPVQNKVITQELENYVKNTDYATYENAGVVKVGHMGGLTCHPDSGQLAVNTASENDIKSKGSLSSFITPFKLDYAVKVGVTTNTQTLTDEEQKSAQKWLGISNDVFMATYGTTTYEEILEAYQSNKGVFLTKNGINNNDLISAIMTLARVDNNNDNSTDRYTFTFSADENGVTHWASINYATKTWNYWNYDYAAKLNSHDEFMVAVNNRALQNSTDILNNTTNYKYEHIAENGKFQLREKGFYIFGGSDYDLNLCDASGNTIGKTESLVIIVFCTEADENGNFRVYVMQNYKTVLGVSSMDGMPYHGFTRDYYVHNTNTSQPAYVYYMRQNEV